MADARFGFRPVMHIGGAPYNGAANAYLATNGTNLFIGDAVLITGQSNTTEINGNPPGSLPIVTQPGTANTSAISGVVVGIVPTNADSAPYYAGSKTATQIWVCDDPSVLFEVQCDGTLTQDDVGSATVLVTTHAGSTVTYRSGSEVSATTATQGVFVIERVNPTPDNEVGDANSQVLVRVAKHTRGPSGGKASGLGVGIA